MSRKTIFIAAVVVLAAMFAGAFQFYKNKQAQEAAQIAARNREALVRPHAPTVGDANAPVHIVEFLDPACETCRAFSPMVKKLMAENPGKIRLSLRYAPFHPGSPEVVKALEASRKQDRYWPALESLLAAQSRWTINHRAQVDQIWDHLARAGVDVDRAKADMQSPEIAKLVAQDIADARTLNVTKTPEFFVNGRPLPSFGYQQLVTLVQEELAGSGAR